MLRLLVPVLTFVGLSLLPAQFFPARVVSGGGGSQMLYSDLTEVGAWRMPSSGVDMTFSKPVNGGGAAIAGRDVGGEQRIFLIGKSNGNNATTGWPLYEVGLVNAPSAFTSYATANRATFRTNWGTTASGGYRGTCPKSWNAGGTEQSPIDNFTPGGMYYAEGTGLYWTYGNAYASTGDDWGLCLTTLDNPTGPVTTQYGPWRIKAAIGNGSTFRYGAMRALYIQDDALSGSGFLTSSTIYTSNTRTSFGPSLHHLAALPTSGTPSGFGNPDIVTDAGYADYPIPNFKNGVPNLFSSLRRDFQIVNFESTEGHITADPAQNSGYSSWQQLDNGIGFAAVTNGVKSAVFQFVQLIGNTGQNTPPSTSCSVSAHTTYCNVGAGNIDDHCDCSDDAIYSDNIGPAATLGSRFFGVATYSYADLLTSTLNGGATQPYQIYPVEMTDIATAEGIKLDAVWTVADGAVSGCCYVNRTTRRIYAVSQGMVGSCTAASSACDAIILAWEYPAAPRPSALLTASFSMAVAAPFYLFRRRKVMT